MKVQYFMSESLKDGGVAQIIVEENEVAEMRCYHKSILEALETRDPSAYSKLQSDLDSGLAMLVDEDDVAVCCYTDDEYTRGCFYKVKAKDAADFKNKFNAVCKPISKSFSMVCTVDGEEETFYDNTNGKRVAKRITQVRLPGEEPAKKSNSDILAAAMGAMGGVDGAAISEELDREHEQAIHEQEEAYTQRQKESVHTTDNGIAIPNDMIRGGMVNSDFMCAEDSPAIICGKAFHQKFYVEPKSKSQHLKLFMDKRYPVKYAPAMYEGKPGYAILVNKEDARVLYGGSLIPTEEEVQYQFYELNTELFDYKPDVLPETIFHEGALKKYLKFTDKVKINVNGLSNLLANTVGDDGKENQEAEEKNTQLIQFFARFLLNVDFFTITSVSGDTGWVTAYTPRGTQVLLMACVRKGDTRDGLCSFIPIKGVVGIAVAGLTVDDFNDLAELVVRYAV